jgi:tRNA-specific 2-thiouridylase
VKFKIRHTPQFTQGKMTRIGDVFRIESEDKIQGIASGQFGVVYDNDAKLCVGSGVII